MYKQTSVTRLENTQSGPVNEYVTKIMFNIKVYIPTGSSVPVENSNSL